MKSDRLKILRILSNIFLSALSLFNNPYQTEKNKIKKTGSANSICRHCGGTGWINKNKLENLLPSRHENLVNNPYSLCPVCKGAGYAKID